MAIIKFFQGTKEELDSKPIEDGALYVTTVTKELFLDNEEERLEISKSPKIKVVSWTTDDIQEVE